MRPPIIEVSQEQTLIRRDLEDLAPIVVSNAAAPVAYPVVKWAGGKQWLAPAGKQLTPPRWNGTYHEPLAGGAALFFSLAPTQATLVDSNPELIATYRALQDDPDGVIRLLSAYPYDKKFYYAIRERIPRRPCTVAARFLYLNRACWNGLYRVNQEGKFNTPFGCFKNPTICDPGRIRSASEVLANTRLVTGDFATVLSNAQAQDFVYFDPPYITGHQNNGFHRYNRRLFSWEDQKRLAQVALKLVEQGVHVLISNADHKPVVDLYKGFFYYRAIRQSLIGGKTSSRRAITEALLASYPLMGCESEVIK